MIKKLLEFFKSKMPTPKVIENECYSDKYEWGLIMLHYEWEGADRYLVKNPRYDIQATGRWRLIDKPNDGIYLEIEAVNKNNPNGQPFWAPESRLEIEALPNIKTYDCRERS